MRATRHPAHRPLAPPLIWVRLQLAVCTLLLLAALAWGAAGRAAEPALGTWPAQHSRAVDAMEDQGSAARGLPAMAGPQGGTEAERKRQLDQYVYAKLKRVPDEALLTYMDYLGLMLREARRASAVSCVRTLENGFVAWRTPEAAAAADAMLAMVVRAPEAARATLSPDELAALMVPLMRGQAAALGLSRPAYGAAVNHEGPRQQVCRVWISLVARLRAEGPRGAVAFRSLLPDRAQLAAASAATR